MHGFEALRSVMLNKEDRFFLEYQKVRVIETCSESSDSGNSSNGIHAGDLAPYGEVSERKRFRQKLHRYLNEYEGHTLQES